MSGKETSLKGEHTKLFWQRWGFSAKLKICNSNAPFLASPIH